MLTVQNANVLAFIAKLEEDVLFYSSFLKILIADLISVQSTSTTAIAIFESVVGKNIIR